MVAEPRGLKYHVSRLKGASQGAWCVMITPQTITEYVRQVLADAQVSVTDRTGTMDHLNVRVVSDLFKGKNVLDRHRLIYQALDEPLKDGRIHALELTAETTDGS